jgi:hypothetical protein
MSALSGRATGANRPEDNEIEREGLPDRKELKMKLYEHPRTEETLDRLPELPEGVVVPDDISGLQPPTSVKPAAGAVRWMRWLAAIVVLGAVGVLAAVLFSGSDTAIETAQVEVSHSTNQGPGSTSLAAVPWAPATVYGSDRHFGAMADLSIDAAVTVDLMETVGTDNPVFVAASAPALGSDRHLSTLAEQSAASTVNYMELYGTDNPVFVQATTAAPAFPDTSDLGFSAVPATTAATVFPDSPDLGFSNVQATTTAAPVLGSDRHLSTLAERSAAAIATGEYMELYGTDNPVFVGAAPAAPMFPNSSDLGFSDVLETSNYMEMYGTDNPVFVQAASGTVVGTWATEGPGSNSLSADVVVFAQAAEHPYADFFG